MVIMFHFTFPGGTPLPATDVVDIRVHVRITDHSTRAAEFCQQVAKNAGAGMGAGFPALAYRELGVKGYNYNLTYSNQYLNKL
jgi:hypothetical protein